MTCGIESCLNGRSFSYGDRAITKIPSTLCFQIILDWTLQSCMWPNFQNVVDGWYTSIICLRHDFHFLGRARSHLRQSGRELHRGSHVLHPVVSLLHLI